MDKQCPFVSSEKKGVYIVAKTVNEVEIICMAKKIVTDRLQRDTFIKTPKEMRDYFTLQMAELEHEVFMVVYLDNSHGIISMEELFRGTIDSATVYPREVVKRALACNACAVIFAHNHPSGNPEPSLADRRITEKLVNSLALVDIRVLDHFVIAGVEMTSFAERGIL